MRREPLVYVIVVNWNGLQHLQTCLDSLSRQSYANHKVLMVDNGSTDGSPDFVSARYPQIEIIRNGRNLGFAGGNNVGMRFALESGCEYVCLLNNDTEADGGWLERLVAFAEGNRDAGVLASKMLYFYSRDFINSMGTCLTRLAVGWDQYDGRLDDEDFSTPQEAIAACGGAFFIRADALKKTGLFDPHYFMYMEDTDFCIRLWQRGYRVVTVPAAVVYHKFSGSSEEGAPWKHCLLLRNRLYFMTKLYPWKAVVEFLPVVIKRELDNARSFHRQGRGQYSRAVYAALAKYLALLPHALAYRMRSGSPFTHKTWQMLRPPESAPPVKKVYFPPLQLDRGALSNSVVMGTAEAGLGAGWYALDREGSAHYRWMARRAHACLNNPGGKSDRLLIRARNPFRDLGEATLRILCNGKVIGTCEPRPEWDSYRFAGRLPQGILEITLVSDRVYKAEATRCPGDYSFCVKEITITNE